MRNYKLKDDTMNETELQRVFNFPIYPRDSKIQSDKAFVNIDSGRMGGTHWTCSIIKVKNHTTLIVSEVNQINFYSNNYLS